MGAGVTGATVIPVRSNHANIRRPRAAVRRIWKGVRHGAPFTARILSFAVHIEVAIITAATAAFMLLPFVSGDSHLTFRDHFTWRHDARTASHLCSSRSRNYCRVP
jgi:hypothetical protein